MASNYNASYKRFNGLDWDTFYFETTVEQVNGLQTILDGLANITNSVYYVQGNTTGIAGTWTGTISGLTEYYNGLKIAYQVGILPAETTTININNLGAITILGNSGSFSVNALVNNVLYLTYITISGTGYFVWSDATGSGSASVTVGSTPPADPNSGDLWWDDTTGSLYIYYDDDTSAQWVEVSSSQFVGVSQDLANHITDTNNPHSVTAAQVGSYTTAQADANFEPKNANIQAHISATDNPHGVTAAQVGAYTTSETDTAISNAITAVIDASPETLDTLNELAAAINDDPLFFQNTQNAIDGKANLNHTHTVADINSESSIAGYVLASDGDGTASWQEISGGASVTTSETAPSNPEDGDLWFNSSAGSLFIYYNDGTSSQWIDLGSVPTVFGVSSVNGKTGDVSLVINDVTGLQTQLDGYDTHVADNTIHFTQSQISITESQISDFGSYEPANANIQTHISSTSNPHGVTAAQVGAYTTGETDTAISTAINNLVDTAPDALNTLNELAAALGDDENFATTVTNSLAGKSDVGHTHDDRYYTETEVDEKFNDLVFSINDPVDDLNGLTLQEVFGDGNVLTNPNFDNGTSGWVPVNTTVVNGKMVFNTSSDAYFYQDISGTSGDTVFAFAKMSNYVSGDLLIYNNPSYILNSNDIIGYKYVPSNNRFLFDNSGNQPTQYDIDYVGAINLTDLGLTALTEAQLNYYLDLYQALKPQQLPDTTTHTQTESIKSVPVGTLDGQVSSFEAEGLTLVNIIANGDFSTSNDYWNHNHGSSVITGNRLQITNKTSDTFANFYYTNGAIQSGQYFIYLKADMNGYTFNQLDFYPNENTTYATVYTTNFTGVNDVYGIKNSAGGTLHFSIFTVEIDATYYIDNIMLINMTALGIESYTEAQMLDLVRSGYFEGIANVDNPSVTAVGKNLFDLNTDFPGKGSGSETFFVSNNQLTVTGDFFRSKSVSVKPNTNYYLSYNAVSGTVYNAVSIWNGAFTANIRTFAGVFNSGNYNSINILFYGGSGTVGTSVYENIQIEEGSTATAYEPYKSSTLALNTPLRSLPNGVRDRVYEQNGEVWLEKRVEEYTLQASDISFFVDGNPQYIRFPKKADGLFPTTAGGTTIVRAYNVDGFVSISNSVIAGYLFENTLTTMGLAFPSGKYADLAAAQADLAGTVVQYQLATPQLINLTEQGLADGQLTAYGNGTVYNTSTTFHPDIQFAVNSNRSAQIEALIDNSDYQAKLIDSKASKVQEDWIEPTLLNGWVNFGSGLQTAGYYKDEFGFVHLRGFIRSGTITYTTQFFILPQDYRPSANKIRYVVTNNGSSVNPSTIIINTGGEVFIDGAMGNTWVILDGISFKVGE